MLRKRNSSLDASIAPLCRSCSAMLKAGMSTESYKSIRRFPLRHWPTMVCASSWSIARKGESLIDTGWTVTALGADVIVMRHPNSGAPYLLSRYVPVPVINAGDGLHQHPSQALLDALTITNHKKQLKGLRVVIVGDVFHSRVARSNAILLSKFGVEVIFCGPSDLVPDVSATIAPGVAACHDLDAALQGADVVMSLRIQKERLAGKQINLEDYIAN